MLKNFDKCQKGFGSGWELKYMWMLSNCRKTEKAFQAKRTVYLKGHGKR